MLILSYCVAKAIANTHKGVNEKYKYVGILSDESAKLNKATQERATLNQMRSKNMLVSLLIEP